MMGMFDKLKKAIQPDDNDYDGSPDEVYDYDYDPILNNSQNNIFNQSDQYGQGGYGPNDYGGIQGGMGQQGIAMGGSAISSHTTVEMKIAKPKIYKNVSLIANDLLNKKTIIMLLDETDSKETARRLIDFMSGVAFAIDGKVKKINPTTIMIAPSDVDISNVPLDNVNKKTNSGEDIFD